MNIRQAETRLDIDQNFLLFQVKELMGKPVYIFKRNIISFIRTHFLNIIKSPTNGKALSPEQFRKVT